jgi:hypothetical protein
MENVFTYRILRPLPLKIDIAVVIPLMPNQPIDVIKMKEVWEYFKNLINKLPEPEVNEDAQTLARLIYKKSKSNQSIVVNGITITVTVPEESLEIAHAFNRNDLVLGNT